MATITGGGRAIEVKNLTISSSDDTQVGFIQPVNSIVLRCRTANVDLQVRASRNASDFITIPAGSSMSIDIVGNAISGTTQPTNIWLRGSTGSPVIEILGIYGG